MSDFYEDYSNMGEFPALDGQEYQPSPQILPDTRTGYDQDGNYHAISNDAGMHTMHTPNFPYRLAAQIQESIVMQAEQNDYMVGRAERHDMAFDIAYDWFNNRTVEPPELALEALHYWQRIYGRGVQGE